MADEGKKVDITPKDMGGKGSKGADRKFTFQETEMNIIRNNPGRLTKEGIKKKIHMAKYESNNSQVEAMYKAMLKNCKNIKKSKTTERELPDQNWSGKKDGSTAPKKLYKCQVLSYDKKGQPFWLDPIKEIKEKK